MPGMERMQGMDHSKMPGIEPKQSPGASPAPSPQMDHSKMPGMAPEPQNKETLEKEMKQTSDEMKRTSDAMKKKSDEAKKNGVIFTCVMHPEVKSDKPGNCPKCGMKLVEKEEGK